MMGQYACYFENVRADNPEYFNELFASEPALEHQFDHFQMYGAALSDFSLGVCAKHAVELISGKAINDPETARMVSSKLQMIDDGLKADRTGSPPHRVAPVGRQGRIRAVSPESVLSEPFDPRTKETITAEQLSPPSMTTP
jgi:hypothetical protein